MPKKNAIVIGAGIVGLAMARSLASRGWAVTVMERDNRASGASVRNFGMVWPIGQPLGKLYNRAINSRNIWKSICDEAGIWYDSSGSVQLAHEETEWAVINEFYDQNLYERELELLSRKQLLSRFNGLVSRGLKGGFYSAGELIVDPREALARLPEYLAQKYGVKFMFNTAISRITGNVVYSGGRSWKADKILHCSGQDFETLFPEVFSKSGITKCKLQMMRTVSQPGNWSIGASLSAGLTLIHYQAFSACPSIERLRLRFADELPEYIRWGIHVMVSQNGQFEFTIGDTHEYGLDTDPFIRASLNKLVLDYLGKFVRIPDPGIAQYWQGVYPKLKHKTELVRVVDDHTTIVNGLGGAGMTLSFGLAEELASKWS